MNKVEKKDFESYLGEARSWETTKLLEVEKSKKVAWCVAAAGVFIGILGVASSTLVATQEPPPPVVIRVDSSTGIVDVVNSLKDGKTNYEEAVNKFFTQWYVRYREGYSSELKEEYYSNVGLMSVGLEQQKYFESFNPKNSQSPINIYGPYAKVKIQVKGTSFIKPNVALVRYIKLIERGTGKPEITHWAATITFKYSGAPMKEKDRAVNPLGFQVTEYRNDPDAPGPDATALAQPMVEEAAPAPLAMPISAPAPLNAQPLQAPVVPAIQAKQ
jgi:type IV secretion system protein VirB8